MDRRKQDALIRLASAEPRDLCAEAKVEHCRAARDLQSCGRPVHRVLGPCGHACLCAECGHRAEFCPVCRVPVVDPESSPLRLYDELAVANLLPRVAAGGSENDDPQFPSADVRRLGAIFDAALENNLVSLVCHYVSEVCVNEELVSSDVLMSMLLDGDVVKNWCKRTLASVVGTLGEVYSSELREIESRADTMQRSLRKLEGVQNVLEALEAPVIDTQSTSLLEVRNLLGTLRKAVQHLEIMAWCTRHSFLENLPSKYADVLQWRMAVTERKTAARERAEGRGARRFSRAASDRTVGTLFIEDALENLGMGGDEVMTEDVDLQQLKQKSVPASISHWRESNGGAYPVISGSDVYPPENVRAAVDLLFLGGAPELIPAKRATFLYYLFDRQWGAPDGSWKSVVDDYVATFGLSRPFMLECLLLYLLDDNSDEALREACGLLPDLIGPSIHPKVSHVLLEKGLPNMALSVLCGSGRDGRFGTVSGSRSQPSSVSLSEAVIALKVRLECGFLAEGFLYQRAHWSRVKAGGGGSSGTATEKQYIAEDSEGPRNWAEELIALVEEICWFSIEMNRLKEMTELPWQADEEKVVRRCLLDHAERDPASVAGNFLVAFYVQRCMYAEAYAMHQRIDDLERQYVAQCTHEHKRKRIQTARAHRLRIVDTCVDLLPPIQKRQISTSGTAVPDHHFVRSVEIEMET